MERGEFKLAIQTGTKGYYGKVTLEVEPTDSEGVVTIIFAAGLEERWQIGVRFGIDYVLERIDKRNHFPKGGRVYVQNIGANPVDSTNIIIAFVAANALYKALGVVPSNRFHFDQASGNFCFPNSAGD